MLKERYHVSNLWTKCVVVVKSVFQSNKRRFVFLDSMVMIAYLIFCSCFGCWSGSRTEVELRGREHRIVRTEEQAAEFRKVDELRWLGNPVFQIQTCPRWHFVRTGIRFRPKLLARRSRSPWIVRGRLSCRIVVAMLKSRESENIRKHCLFNEIRIKRMMLKFTIC